MAERRKPPGEAETCAALVRAGESVVAALGEVLRPHGLSEPGFNVLRILRGAGKEGLPCGAIRDRMVTRVPDVTRLVDRLERRGLVRRARGKADRRVVRVALEPAGRDLLAQLDAPIAAAQQRLLADLLARQRADLLRLLHSLAKE